MTTTENADSVPLPSMSLCPGFRVPDRDYYEQYEDLHEFLESDPDITEEDLLSWWHNETYEIQDIVTGVRPDYARKRNLTPITILATSPNGKVGAKVNSVIEIPNAPIEGPLGVF